MNSSHDWLEVVDVEGPWIEVAVPSNDIERMVIEHDLVDSIVLLYEDREVTHLVNRLDESRTSNVALRVWCSFDQLAKLIPIALRPAHVSPALEDHKLGLILRAQVKPISMEDSSMDYEIVSFVERKRTVSALEHAGALAHVDELVCLRVPIEVRVVLIGLDVEHGDVLIEQERHAIERRAPAL